MPRLPARRDLAALIFDMDGLLIDSEPLWWRCERALAAEHGLAWSDADAERCVGGGLPNVIRVMRERGLPVEVDAGVARLVELFIAGIAELELKLGCAALLDAARAGGVRTALASSSTRRLIGAVLDRFQLHTHFHAVVSGEDVARPKPAPDIFLAAARALDVETVGAVVLEDSLAGVRAALAAHLAVIAVPEFQREAFAPLTEHVVADLHEARRLLGL